MSDALGFLPDTKPDVAEAWRKVLLDAADYIDEHGWCPEGVGAHGSIDDGRVCPAIACYRVAGFGLGILTASQFMRKTGRDFPQFNAACSSAAEVTSALRACARS